MKHWSLWILFGVSLLFGVSCGKEPETPQPVMVKGITLSASSLTLTEGETANLVATISPKDADNKTVIWSSSNGSVASVDNGKVTALKAGETTIIAKSDDGGFTSSCSITVNPKIIEVTSITLSTDVLSLVEGKSETLVATIKPDDATDKAIIWSTSDATIATVEGGKVSALKEGTSTITAKAGNKSATCTVKVSSSSIPVNGVSLNKVSLSMDVGNSQTLTASVSPSYATNKEVTWSSSNTSIATVSSSGVITAKAAGTATITVKTKDGGKTASCKVTVSASSVPVTGVSLNKTSLSMTVGNTQTLTATITPSNATNKEVTWSSSNTSVATVSSSGVVTAKAVGTATITVKAKDGGKTATCSITVKAATVSVTGVSLNVTALSMTIGDTQTLTATITPSNATNKSVTWSSSNTSVATVSSSGVVTAKAAGTATITVKTKDGSKTAKCSVTVEEALSLKGYKVFIKHGGEFLYDDISEYGTYAGHAFSSPNTKYNYAGDNHELRATPADFNNVFRELGMTFEQFQSAYNVDEPILFVAENNGEPGDLPDVGLYKYSVDLGELNFIYGEGLILEKISPSNWLEADFECNMILDPSISFGGPHFVYIVYLARDNTKDVDVVVKFVYNVK